MRKSISTVLLVAVPLFLLIGCVIPGTGTVQIRNELTSCRVITALYLYQVGARDKGASIIRSPLCPNEFHTQDNIEPGEYIIEAEIDNGVETAIIRQIVEEGTYYYLSIYNSNIL